MSEKLTRDDLRNLRKSIRGRADIESVVLPVGAVLRAVMFCERADAAMRAVVDAADAWRAGHKDDGKDVDLYEAAVSLRALLLPEEEA